MQNIYDYTILNYMLNLFSESVVIIISLVFLLLLGFK